MKRKLLSLLILAALLLSLFPFAALAEEPEEGETEEAAEGREGLGNVWGIPADDVIYLGYYAETPVAWLVLDADQNNMGTEGVYLLSRDLIDSGKVAFDESSTLWEGSLAQEWCTNFAETAFSPVESTLIPHTDKYEAATYPNQLYGITWGEVELKQEQVFFLSIPELEHYFGSYAPDYKYTVKPCSMDNYYWLRTPHYYHEDYHSMVLQSNMIHDYLPWALWAARPCINLDLQDAVYLLPAADEGQPGPVELPQAEEGQSREWKLLAPMEEHSFRAETTAVSDGELTASYSGAEVGEGFMLSLLIRDAEGKALALWRLERPESAQGELTVDLEELELPEGAALYLFCEELGGPYFTNNASPLQELKTELPRPAEASPAPAEPAAPAAQEPGAAPAEPAAQEPGAAPAEPAVPAAQEPGSAPAPVQIPAPARRGSESIVPERLQELLPTIVLGLLAVLALALIIAAVSRRSLAPVILLIELMLLALVLYLRIYGSTPAKEVFFFLR